MRERACELANRWLYGERRSPYELLTEFGRRLSGTLSADELLPGWPTDAPFRRQAASIVPVRAGGQELGHIAVLPARGSRSPGRSAG